MPNTKTMSESSDNFIVLDPQSENDGASPAQFGEQVPLTMPEPVKPNFLIITADSMLCLATLLV